MNHPIKDISIKRFNNLIIFFNGHAWAIVARVREEKKKNWNEATFYRSRFIYSPLGRDTFVCVVFYYYYYFLFYYYFFFNSFELTRF